MEIEWINSTSFHANNLFSSEIDSKPAKISINKKMESSKAKSDSFTNQIALHEQSIVMEIVI